MPTTPTDRETLLARRIRVDIDTATFPASNYEELEAVAELKLPEELRVEDDEHYQDAGAKREAITGYNWGVEGKISYSSNAARTSIDTVQAFLRSMFNLSKTAGTAAAEFGVRWNDRQGLPGSSFEGRCYVKKWDHEGGAPGALDRISFRLQGQGPLSVITNPFGSLVPAVTGLLPTGGAAAGSELIQIFGVNFTGATDVDFGATAADGFTVVTDSQIVALTPPHAAGSVQVKVTNAAGVSPNTAADDFLYA
jgi:hypothetical protein